MSLATFSGRLKLFECEEYSLKASVDLSDEQRIYGRISCSPNGDWFAVAPNAYSDGRLPLVKYEDESKLIARKYVGVPNVVSATFLNRSNRFTLVGNKTGKIFLWDIRKQKVVSKICRNDVKPADFVVSDCQDFYLASAAVSSGLVTLHTLKTQRLVKTLMTPNFSHVSCLRFCLCKQNFLGASTANSTICVWDICKAKLVFKSVLSQTGVCSDFAFSPVNYTLLASVGLTKNLRIFDLREEKPILSVNVGESMNCVDINCEGDVTAVGTVSGYVIVYDLRSSKIQHSFKAHNKPIFSIKFAKGKPREVEPDEVHQRKRSTERRQNYSVCRSKSAGKSPDRVGESESCHNTPENTSDEMDNEEIQEAPKAAVEAAEESPSSAFSQDCFREIMSELASIRKEQLEMSTKILCHLKTIKNQEERISCDCLLVANEPQRNVCRKCQNGCNDARYQCERHTLEERIREREFQLKYLHSDMNCLHRNNLE